MNELELFSYDEKLLVDYPEKYLPMMTLIKENLPMLEEGISMFGKSQSAFMDSMLTVSHPTPIRNLRQILAEVNRSIQALRESHFNLKRKEIEIKKYKRQLETENDPLEIELIQVEIDDRISAMEVTKNYISGAIRKISNHIIQYNSILESIGVKSFDEIDFESEEERYHIMTAFAQALTAARSHGGIIDEGNHIYFYQIGINGATAQIEVKGLLTLEQLYFESNQTPPHELIIKFLNDMADKYKGCSTKYAKYKGMTGEINEIATIRKIEDKK